MIKTFISKNSSPKKVAAICAITITVFTLLILLILQPDWKKTIIASIICLLFTYTIIYQAIQIFFYRKIKLIYKFIHNTKANRKETFFYEKILPQKSIDEVSNEVLKWGEDKRLEIEALQKNEAYRREFLMNLSHEFKTPIFTTQGYIETLLSGAMENPNLRLKFLSNASKAIERLADLAKDLDEISNLEFGKTKLNFSDFKIHELIKNVYDELSLQAAAKHFALEFKKGTEQPLLVHADKEKIRQVVVNLVENAIKYGKYGGSIECGVYEVDEDKAFIEFTDDGPGIEEIHLHRIFERFYRVDSARSRDVGGTGLGLAIVKHIIDAHQQTINVRSKKNVGSSFGFTLAMEK